MKASKDLNLLFEISAFRFVDRTWKQFLNPQAANNMEHSFRVAWIALYLARREKVADTEKVMKMALLHDLSESRTGDAHYVARQYITRNEDLAIEDMFKGTVFEQEMTTLWKEYDAGKSKEAKIVKDADYLDVDMELVELEAMGNQMRKNMKEHRKVFYSKLNTKTAKELWKQIQVTNPHTWHMIGRNRFNDGPWKT